MYAISCLCFDVLRIVNMNVRAYANCLRIYVSNQNHFCTSIFFYVCHWQVFLRVQNRSQSITFYKVERPGKNWRGHQLASTCIFSIDGVHPTSQSSLRFYLCTEMTFLHLTEGRILGNGILKYRVSILAV